MTVAAMLQVHRVFNLTTRQKAAAVGLTPTHQSVDVLVCIVYIPSQEAARRKFCVYEGDHLTLLNIYKAFIRASFQRW